MTPRPHPTAPAALDARLVPAAIAAWTVTCLGLYTGWRSTTVVTAVTAAVAVAVLPHARAAPRGTGGARLLLAVLVVAAGFGGAVSLRMWASGHHPIVSVDDGAWVTVVAEPTDDPRLMRDAGFDGRPRVRIPVRLRHVAWGATAMTAGGSAIVFAPADGWSELLPGQQFTVRARAHRAEGPGTVVALLRADTVPRDVHDPSALQRWAGELRDRFAAAAERVLPPPQAGLLPGLVVGDTSRLTDDVREDFRVTGLVHLTAVSGANVSILLGAVLLLVRAAGIGPRAGVALAALALVAFVIVVRPSPSVVRAAAMGAVALLALVAGRERAALPALGAAVGGCLLVWPDLAIDVGFALSVVATAALIVVAPAWVAGLGARGCPRVVAEALAVSAAAFVVTAPLLAAVTGSVSLVAVAANVLVAPVLAPLTVLGSLVAVIASVAPAAAELPARGTAPMLWWLITVADRAASVPSAEISVPEGLPGAGTVVAFAVGGGVLLRVRPLRRVVAVVGVAVLAAGTVVRVLLPGWPGPGWAFVACDVGQGDALVLAAGDGSAVVVDAGPDAASIDRCLRRLDVGTVPLLVVTHLHADHAGGIRGVFTGRTVGELLVAPGAVVHDGDGLLDAAADAGVRVREAGPDERMRVGDLSLRVLGPPPGPAADENDRSLVLFAATAAGTVLLPGDAEAPALERLLRDEVEVRADVLKVPHHGSRTTPAGFLAAVRPRLAVISVGAANPYGHPHPDVLARLEDAGARVLRTDLHGDIAVVRAGSGALAVVSDRRGTIDP